METEDLVQEVFARAFSQSSRDRYDRERPFVGYLLGIARNLIVDLRRAASREACRRFHGDANGFADPEPELHLREIFRIYGQVAASLDAVLRTVLVARFIKGESRASISAQTGLTPYAVRLAEQELVEQLRALSAR
jgi:RNA polymerase sigma factor (sigma-70 family)